MLLLFCFAFSNSQRSKLSQWIYLDISFNRRFEIKKPKVRGKLWVWAHCEVFDILYQSIDLWFFVCCVASKQFNLLSVIYLQTPSNRATVRATIFSATVLSNRWGYLNRPLWVMALTCRFFFVDLFIENARNSNVNCYYKWQINEL